ncbi:MAG: murein transglycosylase domain-containing protein [Campylobacterota bacterium]
MRYICIFFLLFLPLHASIIQNNDTIPSENERNISLQSYQEAYSQAFTAFEKKIAQNFPTVDVGDKNRWVSYIDNFKTKNVIDYKNEKIIIQTYANNLQSARQKISKRFEALLHMSIKDAYSEDFVEQEVVKTLNLQQTIQAEDKLIGDIYNKRDISKAREYILTHKIEKSEFKSSNIYTLEIKMPNRALLKKAKDYKSTIEKYAYENRLPMELIYAIIHSESSFNPMARSRTPAFGLMQIVPQTAGIDSYKFLYGQKKLLSANYLYDEDQNIKIGVAYLHILFYKYFKDIKDPLSRMYATIAAYNGGTGNLCRTFVGSTDIKRASARINEMQAKDVYLFIQNNHPFQETKQYLDRVKDRLFVYRTWLLET